MCPGYLARSVGHRASLRGVLCCERFAAAVEAADRSLESQVDLAELPPCLSALHHTGNAYKEDDTDDSQNGRVVGRHCSYLPAGVQKGLVAVLLSSSGLLSFASGLDGIVRRFGFRNRR